MGGAWAGPGQGRPSPQRPRSVDGRIDVAKTFNHPKLIQVLKAVFIGTPTSCFIDIKDRL